MWTVPCARCKADRYQWHEGPEREDQDDCQVSHWGGDQDQGQDCPDGYRNLPGEDPQLNEGVPQHG